MKILFISRSTLFKDKGGDTVQVQNTASYLRKIDVEVDIRLCNEQIDYAIYDLIHFFNIIRPADILRHIEQSKKPYVVSTIYVDYSEYEKKARQGISGLLFKMVPGDAIEYTKVIARFLVNGERIISPSYILLGQSRSIKKIMREAAMLLPNSANEYRRLVSHYKIKTRFEVIPNAVDPVLFSSDSGSWLHDPDLIICAGRIEGRKNQLNLIKALHNTRFKLVIIGSASPNQSTYFEACKEAAGSNVSFVGNLPQQELISYYQRAKVHVLPSWFETTGLSSLEAAAMGCNIVVTPKGDTVEYFENYAFYCEPDSVHSIFEAIEKASLAPYDEALRHKIFTRYTWLQAAAKTKAAYQEIMQRNS
ncbi:MAG: glycosyltransferase family 4 protein [Chitinophagaceae bacterium]|nr:glycosyltransferase family 4 protein [Chitinophagaceae bacterium]